MKLWKSLKISIGSKSETKAYGHDLPQWGGQGYELDVFKSQTSLSTDSGLCTERGLRRTHIEIIKPPGKRIGLKLAEHLKTLEYRVQCIQVNDRNLCIIALCGHEVFRCNLSNLKTNTSVHLDPVAARAVNAVSEATELLTGATNYFWIRDCVLDINFILRRKYLIKDEWLPKEWYENVPPRTAARLKKKERSDEDEEMATQVVII